mgnify:CR=1 FL=1
MKLFNYLKYLINIILFIIAVIYFIFIVSIGNILLKSGYDRIKIVKYLNFFNFLLNVIFKNRVTSVKLLKNNINIVNGNHFHNIDWIIFCYFFYINQIDFSSISSISSIENTNDFELKVFNNISSILINRNTGTVLNLKKNIVRFNKRKYNTHIICSFEGNSLNHLENIPKNLLLEPKVGIYTQLSKEFPEKKFNDLTFIYLYHGKIMDPSDKYFILKLLSPYCNIIVKNDVYIFPRDNHKYHLDKIYQKKQSYLNYYLFLHLSKAFLNSEKVIS